MRTKLGHLVLLLLAVLAGGRPVVAQERRPPGPPADRSDSGLTGGLKWISRITGSASSKPAASQPAMGGKWLEDPAPQLPATKAPQAGTVVFPAHGRLGLVPLPPRGNLQAVLLCQDASGPEQRFITLEEGIRSGQVRVSETPAARVQELQVENLGQQALFIQMGDLVKGGRQDRTMHASLVVAGRSGPVGVGSLCVEAGRWSGDNRFAAGGRMVPSSELRSAVFNRHQREVWNRVASFNRRAVPARPQAPAVYRQTGRTSLFSGLESVDDGNARTSFISQCEQAAQRHSAAGLACFVDGQLRTLDVYSSPSLFRSVMPKLLAACLADAAGDNGAGRAATGAQTANEKLQIERAIAEAFAGQRVSEEMPGGNVFTRMVSDRWCASQLMVHARAIHSQIFPRAAASQPPASSAPPPARPAGERPGRN